MGKGYLTEQCVKCEYWHDEEKSKRQPRGCRRPFVELNCRAYAKAVKKEHIFDFWAKREAEAKFKLRRKAALAKTGGK